METIKDFISKNFDINYSISAISRLLKKRGIKRLKPKLIPGKPPSFAKQYGFILHYLMLKKLQCNDDSMVQLFVDGMHLVHQVIPTFYWGSSKDRLVFNSNSSRNRYYEKYKTFRAKVFILLNNLQDYTDKLKTLITDNFEIVLQKWCQEKPKSNYYMYLVE